MKWVDSTGAEVAELTAEDFVTAAAYVLDANNAKLMAEVELANARVSIIFNYYKLLYLSGNI